MPFMFADLDERTRQLMVLELQQDVDQSRVYQSPRLTQEGLDAFPTLLLNACTRGDDVSLATALSRPGVLKSHEISHSRTGKEFVKEVPINAAETLAEGEFNRLYARALCRRAIEDSLTLVVYRAKQVAVPRTASKALIGQSFDPTQLLADLLAHPGVEPALGLPPGPNSGLSVRLT